MFSDPLSNLRQLGLHENMIVADLGAGTGFYAVAAGRLVPQGKVYAVEVQKELLGTIQQKVKSEKVNNVECLWGNIEKKGGTKIGDRIVDAVIASNVLFQTEDRDGFIQEIKRILKPGGRVLLIDWSDASSSLGPTFKTIVPKASAREMFMKADLNWERDIDAGAHHYGMIFRK